MEGPSQQQYLNMEQHTVLKGKFIHTTGICLAEANKDTAPILNAAQQLQNFPAQPAVLPTACPRYSTDNNHQQTISILYQNCRSLRSKIDDVFLAMHENDFDVIILTETGLNCSINSEQLFGSKYNVHRCDRNANNSNKSSGGGVLISVAVQYPSSTVTLENGKSIEQICVSSTVKNKKIMFCVLYLPPDNSRSVSHIDAHLASINELRSLGRSNDALLVCGDYNQPHIVWRKTEEGIKPNRTSLLPASSTTLLDGMDFFNLNQSNVCANHLGRVLDLVFYPENEIDVALSEVPLVPADLHHPPLFISLATQDVQETTRAAVNINRLNYRKLNFENFTVYFRDFNWLELFADCDVNAMARKFCLIIQQWLNSNLPLAKPAVSPPWSTSRLKKLKCITRRCLRKLRLNKNLETRQNFKTASSRYRRLNSLLYKSYVMRVQTDLRRNPRNFWNFVNSKRKSSSIPANLFLEEATCDNDFDSCELFAKFFSSVFAVSKATDCEAEAAVSNVPADCFCLTTFEILPAMIINAAKKLKSSFSPGPDGIPAVIFCRCAEILAAPLCCIFNKSFSEACFPHVWKESFIFPVFKNGDRHNIKNYRGITNLSAASKLFEIVVAGVIQNETKSYISVDQHGFMPGRSVSTNLLSFTSTCIQHIEDKAQVDVIYTDLKAAFDKIDHHILLKKILRLGATNQFVSWLDTYLTGRALRVKLGNSISSPFTNLSGVPQGSNIGPLLFILYFNDAASSLDTGCRLFYADDLKIFKKVQNGDDCLRLQFMLENFVKWCDINKLIISIPKCVVITFHRTTSPIVFEYQIDGVLLQRVYSVNDLGVTLDTKCSFNEHISAVITKANRQLGFIAKVSRDFNNVHCLKALYCALVRPLLENACIVWSPYQLFLDLRIERVQKRFVRLALRHLPWNDPFNLPPYPDRCRLLNLVTLKHRRVIQQALFIAKLLHGEIDSTELVSSLDFRIPQRPLRSTSLLQTRFHRTAYGFHEPFASCIRTFLLHEDLFDFNDSIPVFKSKLFRSMRV